MLRYIRLALPILALPLIAASCPVGPKELGVRVSDAEGFKAGDPILLKGVQIGEVVRVDLENGKPTIVTTVYHAHREAIRMGAQIRLRTPGLLDGGDSRALVVEKTGQGQPLPGGARIEGQETGKFLIKKTTEAIDKAAKAITDALDEVTSVPTQ